MAGGLGFGEGAQASGRRIAAALSGAWRGAPPVPALSAQDLGALAGLLLPTGGGALLWWAIRGTPLATAPAEEELHGAYRSYAVRSALHEREVEAVARRLTRDRIPAVFGKGWMLSRQYPDPGIRPCGDVDVYVRRADHEAARRALADAPCPVDLHDGFAELDDLEPATLLERSMPVSAGAAEARTFGAEDHLRLVALHMLRHGALRPLSLVDVALLAEAGGSRPGGFDVGRLMAGDPRRAAWVAAALDLAQRLLGARLDGLPAGCPPERLPYWLVPTLLREWGSGRVPHGRRQPMSQQLRRPRGLLRALRERWPNAIEATYAVGGGLDDAPRLALKLRFGLGRSVRFLVSGWRPRR